MANTSLLLQILNQIFDAQKKCESENAVKTKRNLDRMQRIIEQEMNWKVHVPTGESYNETRTDCEATIMEGSKANRIADTLKPLVHSLTENKIIQKAVVLV